MPKTALQPGSTDVASVKALQDYLVQQGYMTQAQVDTGYGTYGPKTTAAVASLQKDLGVDNSTGPGYFGPRTIAALQSKVAAAPQDKTISDMNAAITKALAENPDVKAYGGNSDPATILSAYQTGDWSGVIGLSGKPFTDEQQKAAVDQANKALSPAYSAQVANDRAATEEGLKNTQEGFNDFQNSEAKSFG